MNKTKDSMINDNQTIKAVLNRYYEYRFYDDGYGPIFILRDSMGIVGLVRARNESDAYEIAEDELFPEANETIEELQKEFSTIYKSGRDLWMHDNPGKTWEDWQALSEDEKTIAYQSGRNVPFTGLIPDHPCFQEAYGFRPSGPNTSDKHGHGIYAKDLNGESLEKLTARLYDELELNIIVEETEE